MSTSLLDQYRYTISNIELIDPPVSHLTFHKPIFLIKIAKITTDGVNNELLKSSESVKGKFHKNRVVWSEQTLYGVTAESTVNFKILMKKGKKDESEIIGEYTDTVSGLLHTQGSSDPEICKVPLNQRSQLSFTVKEESLKSMLERAKQQSEGTYLAGGEFWSTFCTYFQLVKTAVDPIASLNPYARQVWSIVSIAPNIFQMHETQKINVIKLLEQLMDIYKYISEADRLPVLSDSQRDNLKLLIDKTCECADFIKTYEGNSATRNFTKGPIFDTRISDFKKSFDDIFKTIDRFWVIEIASNIKVSGFLADIPYADSVGLDHEKMCLSGTRETLIKEIQEWVDKDTSERVFILSGHAGTGKSSVAHTIAKTLNNRVGSFFAFNRSNKGKINYLFSTISRNLADHNDLWRRNLVQAIQNIGIRKSFDPITQFDEMIIKPSGGIKTRVVIIIDALDESGDQKERKTLLNLLFERSSELPSDFRILITSRPEHDIAEFHQHSNVHCKLMVDVDRDHTLHDIQKFIRNELSEVAETLDMVDTKWHFLLAQKAQCLFQWAKIACVSILEQGEFEAAQKLKTILSKPTSSLYEMYHQILDAQPDCKSDKYVELLKKCVGAVIVSRKPLSVSDLQAFFGPICGVRREVRAILKPLNSLFIGTTESTADVRPIHTSLFDFFLNPEQKPGTPNLYYITADQSPFTHACLRVMNEKLRFNICGLETSHLRNRDVPNFKCRVAEAIPLYLSYACCFWGYHLEYSDLNVDILEGINDLMRNKLLYFFEVLSLLGEVDHGRSGMQILINKIGDKNSELTARAAEASQFVFEFGRTMMESTPHLYLSSLPYISNETFIFQQFLSQYPHLLSMDVGQPMTLRPQIKDSIAQKHPSACPEAIAFSPQGGQIACGFSNGDLWVWNLVTGEIVSKVGPKENLSAVCKVVFSLNGELVYCCFRDGSILTWEAKTNKVLYESNEGLGPAGYVYCTISPDGRYIAFKGLHDQTCTLFFYERETCVKLFENHCSFRDNIMFSPSGSFFSFEDDDESVEMHFWDTQRRMFVPLFMLIPGYGVKLVALHDNYVITCVSRFNSPDACEIWDIQTRAVVRRFELESMYGGTFALSPNGEYLLFSRRNKCWIYNISTGEITTRFVGGSKYDWPRLTALSPDSKYIAFDTRDTMHVLAWDALVQEESEDKSEDDDTEKWPDFMGFRYHCLETRVKGRHLFSKFTQYSRLPGGHCVRVFDTGMTGPKLDFQVDFRNFPVVEVSPEDNHWSIAYAYESQADLLCLWNNDEKKELILDRLDGKVTALAFSATGDRLISGDSKGNIKIWHVRTRQLISHGVLSGAVTALAFSPIGTTFWVTYEPGKDWVPYETDEKSAIEEWECSESLDIINGPFTHNSTSRSITLFSNKAYICIGSEARYESDSYDSYNLLLLDHSTGASTNCFNTHLFPKFSLNRRYVAWIGTEDQMRVTLWDLEKEGIALDKFPFDDTIATFGFSNDLMRICILGVCPYRQRIDIWDIETKGLVRQFFFSGFHFYDGVALYEDRLLWIGAPKKGAVWDLHVYEIMNSLGNLQSSDRHPQTRRLIDDYKSRSANTEVLDYALGAWNKASFSPRTELVDDWMLGPRDELLFWVPRKMQKGLLYPGMSCTTHEKPTKLNFDKFVHGTRWTECGKQPKP